MQSAGSTCALHTGQDEGKTVKNAERCNDLFCLAMITKVLGGFAVWLLSHYEFSQSVKAVCVCLYVFQCFPPSAWIYYQNEPQL